MTILKTDKIIDKLINISKDQFISISNNEVKFTGYTISLNKNIDKERILFNLEYIWNAYYIITQEELEEELLKEKGE